MKVVILAGGFGTRLSEETHLKPKPMVEVGGIPMLVRIMRIYSNQGFNEFIICLGYKGYLIKEYFANYFLHKSDVTFDLQNNEMTIHDTKTEPWKVTLVDTGVHTMTGGRIKRVKDYVNNETFMLTYGDGLGDIDIQKLLAFHKTKNRLLTVTAVQPTGRFGALNIDKESNVSSFIEKPREGSAWINGGFFVCEPEVINYIDNDTTVWEKEPMEKITEEGQLAAYKHENFWKCMDTLRDKNDLEKMSTLAKVPWEFEKAEV